MKWLNLRIVLGAACVWAAAGCAEINPTPDYQRAAQRISEGHPPTTRDPLQTRRPHPHHTSDPRTAPVRGRRSRAGALVRLGMTHRSNRVSGWANNITEISKEDVLTKSERNFFMLQPRQRLGQQYL